MRRFFVILLVLVVAILGAALILPSLIPAEELRTRAETAASDALGRQVTLDGDIRLQILPTVQVRAQNAAIANEVGFGEEPFAEMAEMRVTVALLPLISRRIEVREFVLVDPVIRLQSQGGRNNWSLGAPGESDAAPAASDGGFVRRPGALPIEASFGDVRIENGTLIYADGSQTRRFDAFNLAVALPSVEEEVALTGSFDADGRPMRFNARLGSLRGLFEGAETPLSVGLDGPLADLSFEGQIDEGEDFAVRGEVDMDLPLPALAAYAGAELPEGGVFRRFAARANLTGDAQRIALNDARVTFDEIAATGDLTLGLAGDRPNLVGTLATTDLDITPYIPADDPSSRAETSGDGVAPWSETPMDLTPLRLVDADLTISADRFKARDVEATDVVVTAELTNGRLVTNLTGFDLYGGQGVVNAVVNARRATPSYSFFADVDNLQALPFLTAAAGFDRLAGLGGVRLDLDAAGASPAAIMASLSGDGDFNFADGALVGVNLAQVIRTVQNAITTGELPAGFSEQQQTDFTSLGGTFTVQAGQVQNIDLAMLSPLIRVDGRGVVNLPGQTIDYRLSPRAVSSLTGQGGEPDLQGVGVPILLRGDFNNVSVGIDFPALVAELARAQATGALDDVLGDDPLSDAVRGLLNRGRGDQADDDEPDEDPGARLLRGLLDATRNRGDGEEEPEGGGEDDGDGDSGG
jgi:AsmA protein